MLQESSIPAPLYSKEEKLRLRETLQPPGTLARGVLFHSLCREKAMVKL